MELVKEADASGGVDVQSVLGDWTPPAEAIATQVAAAPAAGPRVEKRSASVLSAAEQNDPVKIFNENGFAIGDRVREKGVQDRDTYTIIDAGEKVTLEVYDEFQTKDLKIMVPLASFLTSWSVYKGNLPQMLPPQAAAVQHNLVQSDVLRCRAFNVLVDQERAYAKMVERSLAFMMFPHGVVAKVDIPKGALKLAPLTLVSNIFAEKKNQSVAINVGGTNVYATGLVKPSKSDPTELDKFVYAPFWWIESTPDEELVNMKLVAVTLGNIEVPVLQNIRSLKAHGRLFVHKPKETKVALKDAEVVRDGTDGVAKSKAAMHKA